MKKLLYITLVLSLSLVLYSLFSLVGGAFQGRGLRSENRVLRDALKEMETGKAELDRRLDSLEVKDAAVYSKLFSTKAPHVDPLGVLKVDFSEDVPAQAGKTEENFREIFRALARMGKDIPPMGLPLDNVSYGQMAASVGERQSPVYKVARPHTGMDFIVPQGTSVLAGADGVVTEVKHSLKEEGNVVVIKHSDVWKTRYLHLSDITVRTGSRVSAGDEIGSVGMTGNAFIPHLHYEVLKNGEPVDPVNHFFASLNPVEYANMLYMSTYTVQSMD